MTKIQKTLPLFFMLIVTGFILIPDTSEAKNAFTAHQIGSGKSLEGFSLPANHPDKSAPPVKNGHHFSHVPHPGIGTPPHHLHHPK